MKIKNIINILLIFTLLFLLIGVSSASDLDEDTFSVNNNVLTNEIEYTSSDVNDYSYINNHSLNRNYDKEYNSLESSENQEGSVDSDNSEYLHVKQPTELFMYKRSGDSYNTTIKVSGKLLSNGTPVVGRSINIKVLDDDYFAVSDRNGYFTKEYFINEYQNITVTFVFDGDDEYESCNNSTVYSVKQPIDLQYYTIGNTNMGKTIKISGKLYSLETPVKGLTVNITVNGKKFSAISDRNGYFTINYTVDSYDNHEVEFYFSGNKYYEAANKNTSFLIKMPMLLDIYEVPPASFGETISLRGVLFVKDPVGLVPCANKIIKITINGKVYSALTDWNGFTLNYTVDTYEKTKITYRYPGSSFHESVTNYTTFTVKLPTELYIYPRSGDMINTTIKVSGKILSNSTGIKNQLIYIYVNGKRYLVGSTSYGYFTVNHTITSYDDLNITYVYEGSNKYSPCTNSTVYTVLKPLNPTNLFMYKRANDVMGSTIKVSGKLLSDNTPVNGGVVSIKVNDKNYSAVSDHNGYFTINHTIDSYQDLNVTYSYDGNNTFSPCTNSTVYTVLKPLNPTNLFMYKRANDVVGSTIKVSGKLQCNGEGIKGETVIISVNNQNFSAKTGGYGYFTINYTISSYDDLNIIFTYDGNSLYLSSTNSTVYTVVKRDIPTNLFMYKRADDVVGSTIKVSGKLLSDNTPVKGGIIIIDVNGKIYSAVSDHNGYFTVNHTINSYDDLNVTFTYEGHGTYVGCTNSTVYTVLKQKEFPNLFMYTRSGDDYGSTIKVSGKLQCYGEGVKGEIVRINVNGENFTAKTGGYGYFTINYTITGYEDLNVTFTYDGNGKYFATSNSTVYTVVKPMTTNLFMYTRSGDIHGSTIKVSGKLQCYGEGVKGEIVRINVNGENFTAKTGGYGYFTINYTITGYEDLNVTFIYDGGEKYFATSNSTVYTLLTEATNIIIYPRGVIEGNTIKFSGKLLSGGTGVKAQTVTVNVNGVEFNSKTASDGYFVIYYTSDVYEDHTVVCSYAGNGGLTACTNTTTFKLKQSSTMKMISMTDYWLYGLNHELKGRLLTNWDYNVPIRYQNVSIIVNDEIFTVVTDKDGYFNFNYTGQSLDPIRITYKFDGNVFYESAESNFTVEHIYRRTNVIISPVELPTTGNTIEIKIRLMSMGTPITLKRSMCYIRVNGQLLFVPTSPDSQGYIFVNYTMENYGKYTIDVETVSFYPYSTSRNSTTFTWVKT